MFFIGKRNTLPEKHPVDRLAGFFCTRVYGKIK